MDFQSFMQSLDASDCPPELDDCLTALWYDANGDWNRAHAIVQALPGSAAARIHAYLHRKEGDDWNSRYWHKRAGTAYPQGLSLEEEWELLVHQLVS